MKSCGLLVLSHVSTDSFLDLLIDASVNRNRIIVVNDTFDEYFSNHLVGSSQMHRRRMITFFHSPAMQEKSPIRLWYMEYFPPPFVCRSDGSIAEILRDGLPHISCMRGDCLSQFSLVWMIQRYCMSSHFVKVIAFLDRLW